VEVEQDGDAMREVERGTDMVKRRQGVGRIGAGRLALLFKREGTLKKLFKKNWGETSAIRRGARQV